MIGFLVVLCLGMSFVSVPQAHGNTVEVGVDAPPTYTEHEQVLITQESDFVALGCEGSGTAADPYVIEYLLIESEDGRPCIRVSGEYGFDCHYVIRDCILSGSRDVDDYGALNIISSHGTVEGCEVFNCTTGAFFAQSDKAVIGCSFSDCSKSAVRSSDSRGLLIKDNTFEVYGEYAVDVSHSSDTVVEGNTFLSSPSEYQVYLHNVPGVVLRDNNISVSGDGAYVCAEDALIINNTFNIHSGTGLLVGAHGNNTIRDCTFLKASSSTVTGVTIRDARDTTVEGCVAYGAVVYVFDSDRTGVRDSLFYGVVGSAVMVTEVHGTTEDVDITNNTLYDVLGRGVYMDISSGGTVHNNTITTCETAIGVTKGRAYVTNNTVWENELGVYLGRDTAGCEVYYNDIRNNTEDALDKGLANKWHDGAGTGNTWDDAVVVNDQYPEIIEDVPPVFYTPSNYTLGEDRTVVLNVTDVTPLEYEVYLDGEESESGAWDGGVLVLDFSNVSLGAGEHNLTVVLYDRNGNVARREITLLVPVDLVTALTAGAAVVVSLVVVTVVGVKKRGG